jgi:hypothetical protein
VPPRALSAVLPASRCFVIDPTTLTAKRRPALRPRLARFASVVAHVVVIVTQWAQAKWPTVRRTLVSATSAAAQALAAAVTGAAAGASRAWREAQQRRRT